MQFDKAQIRIRPRPNMEAIDLGVLIARRYWWRLVAGWLVVAVPVFVVTWFVPNTIFAFVMLWWFKPLYERIPMTTVASSIFGEYARWPTMRQNLLSPDCLLWLTFFRFFPGRSTLTPIAALEDHASGSGRVSNRRSLIKENIQGAYLGMHSMGLLFEVTIVLFILLMALWLLSPIETDPTIALGIAAMELMNFLLVSFWGPKIVLTALFVAFACVAPFYVCCGFALYLNRRVELEGWDLDLEFQRMVRRIAPLLGVLLLLVCHVPSNAQESVPSQQELSRDTVAAEIDEVVRSERVSKSEVRIKQPEQREESGQTSSVALAMFLRVLVWALLIAGILWLVIKIVMSDYIRQLFTRESKKEVPLHQKFPNLKRTLTLPDDVVSAASDAWREGQFRNAMSLLYRGALYTLITKHKCDINPSDTEASCMKAVRETVPTLSDAFDYIASSWQQLAYARLPVSESDFDALRRTYAEKFNLNA